MKGNSASLLILGIFTALSVHGAEPTVRAKSKDIVPGKYFVPTHNI